MCFSNEPMICIPGEFGIRHADHFYMTQQGPKWFTEPAHSIDDPFGLAQKIRQAPYAHCRLFLRRPCGPA